MDNILARVMPRRWWHWPLSILFWGGVATMFSHGVGAVLYGQPRQSFVSNFYETLLAAGPLVIFGLMLVGHANRLRQEALVMALRDPLTGLLNRRAFLSELDKQRGGALFMLDLDHFKNVNDTYGHLVGDDVLCAVASAMTRTVRSGDFVGRLGGEEFAIFAPGLQGEAAHALGELLAHGAEHIEPYSRNIIRVTASVGGYWSDQKVDTTTFLRKADHALYQAKNAGRAQIIWFAGGPEAAHENPSAVA